MSSLVRGAAERGGQGLWLLTLSYDEIVIAIIDLFDRERRTLCEGAPGTSYATDFRVIRSADVNTDP